MGVVKKDSEQLINLVIDEGLNYINLYYNKCNCVIIKNPNNYPLYVGLTPNISNKKYDYYVCEFGENIIISPNIINEIYILFQTSSNDEKFNLQLKTSLVDNFETNDFNVRKKVLTLSQSFSLTAGTDYIFSSTPIVIFNANVPDDCIFKNGVVEFWTGKFNGSTPLFFKTALQLNSVTGGVGSIQYLDVEEYLNR